MVPIFIELDMYICDNFRISIALELKLNKHVGEQNSDLS
jgi:hypothetical protein